MVTISNTRALPTILNQRVVGSSPSRRTTRQGKDLRHKSLPVSHLGNALLFGSTLSRSCSKVQERAPARKKRALGGHRDSGDDPERAATGDSGPPENISASGHCGRLSADGRCQIGQRVVCPFSGRGAGLCSWHAVAAPVKDSPTSTEPNSDASPSSGSGRRYRCGAPLAKWRHCCDECRAARRRESDRTEHEKWRSRRRRSRSVGVDAQKPSQAAAEGLPGRSGAAVGRLARSRISV